MCACHAATTHGLASRILSKCLHMWCACGDSPDMAYNMILATSAFWLLVPIITAEAMPTIKIRNAPCRSIAGSIDRTAT